MDLRAANLDGAQLQGASLDHAQLQGASFIGVQLQGTSLVGAQMDGALFRNVFVWRTTPPSNTTQVAVVAPEPGPKYSGLGCVPHKDDRCEWSEASYAALKSLIENSVAAGPQRDQALRRIAILEKRPFAMNASSARAWTDLAENAAPAGPYFDTRAKVFKEIGCAAEGAPYVLGSLLKYHDEPSDHNLLKELAPVFLDEVRCPGARGLGKEYKEALQEIRDRAPHQPAGLSAAAR